MARMISRQEAAELLDCSLQTVTNWVEKGFIQGHTIGRALMIDRDSIEKHFDTAREVAKLEQSLIDRKRELQEELIKVDASLNEIKECVLQTQPGEWREVFRTIILGAIGLGRDILHDREYQVLEGYICNKSISEMTEEMGLTRLRVRQIANKAMCKLRDGLNLKELYEQREAMKVETERLKKKVEHLGEIAGKYQSQQDIMKSYSLMEQYEKECSEEVSLLKRRVEDLPLSVRTKNVLRLHDLRTLGDIVSWREGDFLKAKNFGSKSFEELKKYITSLGFSFGMDVKGFKEADFQQWLTRHQSNKNKK